jgi:hypothetical protein
MVLHRDCGAYFAGLNRGDDVLWLNATMPCERLTQPGSRGGLRRRAQAHPDRAAPQDNQHTTSITLQVRRGTTRPVAQVTTLSLATAIVGRIGPALASDATTGSAD